MRRLVAALVIAVIALSIIGCGGEVAQQPVPTSTAPAAPTVTPPDDKLSPTATIGPDQKAFPEPWPLTPSTTPARVQVALDARQPFMLVYLDSSQRVTPDQKAEISAVMKEYSGAIDLVIYDIAKGLPGTGAGPGTEAATATAAANPLRIAKTPGILFVNEHGNITWRFDGYTDRKLLEREILRATAE